MSGIVQGTGTLRYQGRRRDSMALGVGDRFADIRNMHVDAGRFFSEEDVTSRRRYAVIGRVIQQELFGRRIRSARRSRSTTPSSA